MEIERKFLIRQLPAHLEQFPCLSLEQAYLCTDPVVRIRREGDNFYLTYKGRGKMIREEYNLPLHDRAYEHLLKKADGTVITKKRYRVPIHFYTAEVDLFEGILTGLSLAEVEFPTEEAALAFLPPDWMGEEVTQDSRYHNSFLSSLGSREEACAVLGLADS